MALPAEIIAQRGVVKVSESSRSHLLQVRVFRRVHELDVFELGLCYALRCSARKHEGTSDFYSLELAVAWSNARSLLSAEILKCTTTDQVPLQLDVEATSAETIRI